MRLLRQARNTLRLLFRRHRLEDELDAEVRGCFETLVERKIASGLTPNMARREARLEFDSVEQIKQSVRDSRSGASLDFLAHDLFHGVRSLRKNPGFSIVALLTLALGIGVNAALFSVFYSVLLRPLPYDRPQELGLIWTTFEKLGASRAPTSGVVWNELRQRSKLLKEVAAIWVGSGTFTVGGQAEQVKLGFVTTNFLSTLGVNALHGRVFTLDENAGGRLAVVLSNAFWHSRFGGDPSVIGRAVRLNGGPVTVVGIMPEHFELHFPRDSNVPNQVQAFLAFPNRLERAPRTLYYLRLLARTQAGARALQVQSELNSIAAELRQAYPEYAAENMRFEYVPLHADAVRELRPALVALFAGAGLVLLICCVNIANLLLTRANQRRREFAVRSAIGASQGRVLRQLLAESAVLSLVGAGLGVLLGHFGLQLLRAWQPAHLTRIADASIAWPVLLFIAVIVVACATIFGLTPVFEWRRRNLADTLRESGRGALTPVRRRLRAALITAEITLGLILLIGAGLMIQTLANLRSVRPGYEPTQLLTFSVELPGARYPGDKQRLQFFDNWERALTAIPGVESVGGISHLPLDDYPNWYGSYRVEGIPAESSKALLADHRAVTAGFLPAMGARLIEGRFFTPQDRESGMQVAIVDSVLARTTWPGKSPVGQRIEFEHYDNGRFVPRWAEVVGVVENLRHHGLTTPARGQIFVPYPQSSRPHLSFAVRTTLDPSSLAEPIRAALRQLDPEVAASRFQPMTVYVERALGPAGFSALLSGVFAALALALAAVGVYGVVSYSVSQRFSEMGLRAALGASASDIQRTVLGEGVRMSIAGIVLGVIGSLAVSRYFEALVYGITVLDAPTYLVSVIVVLAAALAGCWIPARKAASANPADALRAD